jgi:integrase
MAEADVPARGGRRQDHDAPEDRHAEEDNVRTGFFERHHFDAMLRHLHDELRPVVQFAYITDRRKNEVLTLEWRQVDMQAGVVRLEPGTTKNGKGREFPFTRDLRALLEGQLADHERLKKQGTVVPWVFYRMVAKGRRGKKSPRPIISYLKAFKTACKKAGCPGRLPHDFRRSAVRNLTRAGVPQSVAMKMTGHKTDSVFRRYDIVSPDDLRIAAERLDAATA